MKIFFVLGFLSITVGGALLGGSDHGEHHHDHHDHHDFPLATGKEASQASARLVEFFNAVEQEDVNQLPSDMPLYREVPADIRFTCDGKIPGYYADVDYECQVYHMCREDPEHGVASFLCPNSTVFHQAIFSCDWWFNVDCAASPASYYLNEEIYKDPVEEEETNANSVGPQRFSQPDFGLLGSASLQKSLVSPLSLDSQQFVIPVPQGRNIKKSVNSVSSDYIPPNDGYLPPDTGYLPPTDGYLPPDNGYLPPDNGYLPPDNGYLPPDNGYLPPQKGYLPPTGDYLPPI